MDRLDKEILIELSKNIPICKNPYGDIAGKLKIPINTLFSRIKELQDMGYIKRISGILDHNKTNYKFNAMTVWKVDEESKKDITDVMRQISNISHIYERKPVKGWEYNIYGMIHAINKEEIESIIKYISNQIKTSNYRVLYTKRQWKKTSPVLEELL